MLIYYKVYKVGETFQEVPPDSDLICIIYNTGQTDHCISINLDDNVLRKAPGNNGKNLVAVCPTCQNLHVLTNHAFVEGEKNQ